MKLVVDRAWLRCNRGSSPSRLTVLSANHGFADDAPIATIQDCAPMTNIAPFGMCLSIANPDVARATSAALGVLTPQPCVPKTSAPWTPGSSFAELNGLPLLTDTSKCTCQWAGTIEVADSGQFFASLEQGAAGEGPFEGVEVGESAGASAIPTARRVSLPPWIRLPRGYAIAHQFVCSVTERPIADVRWRIRSRIDGAIIAEGVTGDDGFVVADVPEHGDYPIEYDLPTASPSDEANTMVDASTIERLVD
ncbi:DUF4280 domain-containing protein [Pendulispora albinea]|uniref:DUF4280 domain-containing protein n=1 Tax=Pendulispora albinea TaxID=2741071 RepID=A0ABZ2LPR8_9BACT